MWKIPANGGAEIQVTRKGGMAPLESPEGNFLYYVKRLSAAASVWKVPIEGGEETEVLGSLSIYANMAVGHDGIYFIPTRGTQKPLPFSFSVCHREDRDHLDSGKARSGGLRVSPDGRWILYTQVDQRQRPDAGGEL